MKARKTQHTRAPRTFLVSVLLACAGWPVKSVAYLRNRTTDRAGRAPTRPICDTRPMGGWASFSFFCSGRVGGRRLKIHAGPGAGRVGGRFFDRAPVGVARFFKILPRADLRNPILILMD